MSVPVADVDLRVGGQYRITMRSADGKDYRVTGTYRIVDPPRKLAYTWCWHQELEFESLVTIEFLDRDGSTEIVLRHEALPTAEMCKGHETGWIGILDRLRLEF